MADKEWKSFELRFDGFENLTVARDRFVRSPNFTCFGNQWCVQMYLGELTDSNDGMVGAYLYNMSNQSIAIKYAFAIRGSHKGKSDNGAKDEIIEFAPSVDGLHDRWGSKDFAKHSDIINALVDGALIVDIRMREITKSQTDNTVQATVKSMRRDKGYTKFQVRFDQFEDMPVKKGQFVVSHQFICFDHRWSLYMYPGGISENSDDRKVDFFLDHESDQSINIEYVFSVKNKAHSKTKEFREKKEFAPLQYDRYSWCADYTRSDIIGALVGGTLIVNLRMKQKSQTRKRVASNSFALKGNPHKSASANGDTNLPPLKKMRT